MALDKLTKVQSVGISSFIQVVGVVTATGGFVGDLTGNVTGNITGTTSNASGATGDFSIADKIVHTGDTNTAIRFPAADTFTVDAGGNEVIRVTSAGRLGINNSSPNSALDVAGSSAEMRLTSTGQNRSVLLNSAIGLQIQQTGSKNITFETNSAERLRITSTGNIGINKTPTTYQFEVNGGTANTVASFESTDATSRILFKDNSGEAMVGAVGDALTFYTSTNATERFRIHSTGVPQFTTTGTQYVAASVPAFVVNSNGDHALVLNNQNTTDPRGLFIYQDQDVNNGTSYFLRARAGGTDRAHLYSNGTLQLHSGNLKLASGNGIDFSATANSTNSGSMTSELLDDYEEGSWVPSFGGRSLGTAEGTYTKIGRQVLIQFNIGTLNTSISAGNISVNGLPFQARNINQNGAVFIGDTSGITYASGYGRIYGRINGAGNSMQLLQRANDGSTHTTSPGLGTGLVLRGYAWYTTN